MRWRKKTTIALFFLILCTEVLAMSTPPPPPTVYTEELTKPNFDLKTIKIYTLSVSHIGELGKSPSLLSQNLQESTVILLNKLGPLSFSTQAVSLSTIFRHME